MSDEKKSFNLSLSTSSVQPLKVEAAFKVASMLGYDGVEVMVTPQRDSQDEASIKSFVDKYSLSVNTIHAPTLILCSFVWGHKPEPKLEKTMHLAKAVNAKSVVVHPPLKTNPYSKRFLTFVRQLEEQYEINVAVENMFPWHFKGMNTEMYSPSWDTITENVSSLTLDFSHAAASGLDILSEIKQHHEKVKVIHLCDGTTRKRDKLDPVMDEHLLPGDGDMPIREVFEFLRSVDWQGETVLEINTRKSKNLMEKANPLLKSLKYFKAL